MPKICDRFSIFELSIVVRSTVNRFFLPLLLLMSACTFTLEEPAGITNEITPIKPKGSISLTDYIKADTIYLFARKTFTFDIKNDLSGSQFEGEAYFDNTLFYKFNSRQGQFNIPDTYFKTGVHKLRLSFNESLNDQSLISRFKDLQATIFKEWVVIIDIDPPAKFNVTVSRENGYLKYMWPEYKKAGFISYELSINPGSGSQHLTVNDPSKNFFIDSNYVDGGKAAYIGVTIKTIHGSAEAYATIDEPPIKLSMVFHPEDTTAAFVWNKPKYRGAFKSYVVSDVIANVRTTLANVTTLTDTTLILKVDGAFPDVKQLLFRMIDNSGTELFRAEKSIDFFTGNAMPSADMYGQFWYYSKSANKFIASNGVTINIYDDAFNLLTSRTIERNYFNGITVAWPGNFLHYVASGYTISQLNLVSNEEKSMIINGNYGQAYLPRISGTSNQVVSFYAFENDQVHPWRDIVGLVDMQTGTVLHQEDSRSSTSISDDGRYSTGERKVYSVNGGTQTEIGTIPDDYMFRWFRGDNTDEIITTDYDPYARVDLKTIIVRSSDLTILRTFDPPEAGFSISCYDPSAKTLLLYKVRCQ